MRRDRRYDSFSLLGCESLPCLCSPCPSSVVLSSVSSVDERVRTSASIVVSVCRSVGCWVFLSGQVFPPVIVHRFSCQSIIVVDGVGGLWCLPSLPSLLCRCVVLSSRVVFPRGVIFRIMCCFHHFRSILSLQFAMSMS